MTEPFPSAVRRATAATALALVASGMALTAAPAGAASASLRYDCTSTSPALPGAHVFTAVIDTNAPATLGSGASANITTTATVTVPTTVTGPLQGALVTAVDGTAIATGTVNSTPRQTTLAIPRTAVPATPATTMTLVGTGASGAITGGAAGTSLLLGAGNFTASITGYNAVGAPVGTFAFTCQLQTGQTLLVDTVNVVQAQTSIAVSVLEPPVEYGEQPTATAVVASSVSNAKPAGTVTFTFGGTTVTVQVNGGRATAIFPSALNLGTQQVTAVFTPQDPNLAPSTTTKAFRVVRDQTTTEARAVYRALRDRLVAKALVVAEHGTEVTGSVRFVLKRNGVRIRTSTKLLNDFDKAKKVFRNVDKRGHYTVVARYLGSDTLRRSVDGARVVI